MIGDPADAPAGPGSVAVAAVDAAAAVTHGHLLGGRVRYAQPAEGFRSGIEPVLLAAAIQAHPAERVLEGGSGAGASLLCLAARVPGVQGVGVERDACLVALATRNAEANGAVGLEFLAADVTTMANRGPFDHAFANPPYHHPDGTVSPYPARAQAKRGGRGLLAAWTRALGAQLRHRGTLTVILPAGAVPGCLQAMAEAQCSATAMLPLWPKANRPARLVLVRGIKGSQAPLQVLPGLQLHEADGRFTATAEAILRHGEPLLPLAER